MSSLERAIVIAVAAHAGQRDKAGQPYILHPLRIMLRMATTEERIVAVLHDVVEDSPAWSFERLRAEGFSGEVVAALEALTKHPGEKGTDEGYFAFVRRAAAHPLAQRVKRADLTDNMDLSRLPHPTAADRARVEKYRQALALLEG